jgi:hypothetical protein
MSPITSGVWKRPSNYYVELGLNKSSVWNMKPKDLANVLLKILGVSMCLNAIPTFLTQSFMLLVTFWAAGQASSATHDLFFHQTLVNTVSFTLIEAVRVAIGIYAIVKSRKISEFLFKNEE